MAIYKEKVGNELYVYMNGSLLYKRWINLNHGIIFDKIGLPFRPSLNEFHKKKNNKEKE